MDKEIERKFLINKDAWSALDAGVHFKQGYLSAAKERVVRVRIEGTAASLTIKGLTTGVTRSEFDYLIPLEDAEILLDTLCEQPLIDKHRHTEVHCGKVWEIDVFHGLNEGLIVAEIELGSEEEEFELPVWVLKEVSCDPRYFNSNLLRSPYCTWDGV